MKKAILIHILLLSLFAKPIFAEEITEIKINERAPYSGVLMPLDEFYASEKAQRQLDYVLENPVVCDECGDNSLQPLLMGAILGILIGFSWE